VFAEFETDIRNERQREGSQSEGHRRLHGPVRRHLVKMLWLKNEEWPRFSLSGAQTAELAES
jgi:hypothetical protein